MKKKYITISQPNLLIKQCQCGKFPKLIELNNGYTDLWLQCECGRRTRNMGGFYYDREIPKNEAFMAAVKAWELDDIIWENEI